MRRTIVLAIGLLALLLLAASHESMVPTEFRGESPTSAQRAPEQPLWMYGIGQESCLFWMANPRDDNDVRLWLIGYWTGMNRINEQNHKPISSTNGSGVFGYARKACLEQPSKLISDVAAELYARTLPGGP